MALSHLVFEIPTLQFFGLKDALATFDVHVDWQVWLPTQGFFY